MNYRNQFIEMAEELEAKAKMYRNMAAKFDYPDPEKKVFNSFEQLMHEMDKLNKKKAAAKPKPMSLADIDKELDIIRGVVPTPPGYKIDTERMKSLLRMRKELTRV